MRHRSVALPQPADAPPRAEDRSDWTTLRKLLPYLWRYRWRVGVALVFLLAAKMANVGVPLLLKELVDGLSIRPGSALSLLVVPVGLIVAYGNNLESSCFPYFFSSFSCVPGAVAPSAAENGGTQASRYLYC